MDETKSGFDLEERLLDYAASIVRFTESMHRTPAGLHVAGRKGGEGER